MEERFKEKNLTWWVHLSRWKAARNGEMDLSEKPEERKSGRKESAEMVTGCRGGGLGRE